MEEFHRSAKCQEENKASHERNSSERALLSVLGTRVPEQGQAQGPGIGYLWVPDKKGELGNRCLTCGDNVVLAP